MYPLKKHQNIIMYQNKPYDPGPYKEKSNISLQKEVIEDIVLPKIRMKKNKSKKVSSTLVFRLKNNKEILIDKLNSSNQDTLLTQSSQTSEAVSTSTGEDLKGFWRESLKELSKKLWLPKKTDLHDLDLTYLNGFSHNTTPSSFQIQPNHKTIPKMNYRMTLWQSSQFSVPDIMVKENIKYCRKIRIYPTKEQKEWLDLFFRATRFVWNNAIEFLRDNPDSPKTHISLRDNTMLSDEQLDLPTNKHMRWLQKIPYDTRQLTLKQLASNFKTNFELLKTKQISHFQMGFKSRKNPYQVCFMDKRSLDLKKMRMCKTRIKTPFKIRKRMKKWFLNNKSEGDYIIRREKNRYFLCLPKKKKSLPKSNYNFIHQTYDRVALDPGVRTFQTFYSGQGIAGKIGDNVCNKIIDLGLLEDKLKSKLKDIKKKRTRYNMKKRCFLLRTKIKNIVNDLHWKTCNYLCTNFKHILLPKFATSNMVRKDIPERARVIRSKSVRQMLSLSHYKFKERLKYMGKRMRCKIDIVDESYTTKTCGGCGNLKNMDGLKIYKCTKCNFVLDRDYNGARNIFLKHM